MFKDDALEAAPILQNALRAMLAAVKAAGDRSGADLRTACNRLIVNAEALIQADEVGPPLIECFMLAQAAGATQPQIRVVREGLLAESPVSVGATLIRDNTIRACLATEGRIIGGMTFTNREDVEALKRDMNDSFAYAEEVAADDMALMPYRALVGLHAAITFYLIQTAMPLPQMVRFEFAAPMPSLVIAQRLYYDAGRADELRAENKVVHPAFMKPEGRALSA